MADKKRVHVAVGVVKNSDGEILIAKRADHQHQGGLWEFPGGKVEAGETVPQALIRELQEEVNLDCTSAEITSLMQQSYDYPDKSVLLDIYWVVESFEQKQFKVHARGLEGQPLAWVSIDQLDQYEFPAANTAIIEQLRS